MNEEELRKKAEFCDGCPDWLDVCESECCKRVYIDVDPKYVKWWDDTVDFVVGPMTRDMEWYLRLHGIKYIRDKIKLETNYLEDFNGKLIYTKPCSMLKNGLCEGHNSTQPRICSYPNINGTIDGVNVTERCLFKYKLDK